MTREEHPDEETLICPNCGHEAKGNYCSNCGQENHLHNETFLSMLTHFIAHYFHYESKFWKTIKLLVTRPGFLTKEYFNGRRKRYVAPISLFIFMVLAYFIAHSVLESVFESFGVDTQRNFSMNVNDASATADTTYAVNDTVANTTTTVTSGQLDGEKVMSKVMKFLPKIFFLMVPVLASILSLMFIRRKEAKYLHHIIFSLHYFSFVFIAFFITDLFVYTVLYSYWLALSSIVLLYYFMRSVVVVYGTGWGRSALVSFVTLTLASVVFIIVFVLAVILSAYLSTPH